MERNINEMFSVCENFETTLGEEYKSMIPKKAYLLELGSL